MKSLLRRIVFALILISSASIMTSNAHAQTASAPSTVVGIEPNGSYTTNLDHIDLGDLGIHIDIPLFVHNTQRGGATGISVHLIYDSSYVDWDSSPVTSRPLCSAM